MATMEIAPWAYPPRPVERGSLSGSLSDLFGRRSARENAWHFETTWLRTVISAPEQEETVLRHDEVTLAKTSMTAGRIVIAFSDEQAEQVKRIAEGR